MTRTRRVLALALASLAIAAPAEAQGGLVLLLADDPPAASYATALSVELVPRGARVAVLPAPRPGSIADRALSARGEARAAGADAAVWIEVEADGSASVRAVAPDSELVAWAPLTSAGVELRVFAVVASTLLDELLAAPADTSVTLTIRVPSPEPPAPADALSPPAEAAPMELAPAEPAPVEPAPAEPARRDHYLEIGATFAGVAIGGEVGGGLYLHRNVRLALHARATWVYLAPTFGGALSLSLGYASDDDDGRFEVAAEAGPLLMVHGWVCNGCPGFAEPGLIAGAHTGFSWQLDPMIRLGFRAGGYVGWWSSPVPVGILTLYTQIAP